MNSPTAAQQEEPDLIIRSIPDDISFQVVRSRLMGSQVFREYFFSNFLSYKVFFFRSIYFGSLGDFYRGHVRLL
jgi:hypothetical protein